MTDELEVTEIEIEETPSVDEFLEHFGIKGMHWGVVRERSSGNGRVTGPSVPKQRKLGSYRMSKEQFNSLTKDEQQRHQAKVINKTVLGVYGAGVGALLMSDPLGRYMVKQGVKFVADPKRWAGTATLAKIAIKNGMANRGAQKAAKEGLKAISNLSVYALQKGANGSWG